MIAAILTVLGGLLAVLSAGAAGFALSGKRRAKKRDRSYRETRRRMDDAGDDRGGDGDDAEWLRDYSDRHK